MRERKIRKPQARQAVLNAIAFAGEPISPIDIFATKQARATVRYWLNRLLEEGAIRRAGCGRYVLATTPIPGPRSIAELYPDA
jgi:hypothetical protein